MKPRSENATLPKSVSVSVSVLHIFAVTHAQTATPNTNCCTIPCNAPRDLTFIRTCRTECMAGISELARTQNLASLEHQLCPVRQRLRVVGQEDAQAGFLGA